MGASRNPGSVKASRDQVSGAGPVSLFVSKGERTVNGKVFAVSDKILSVPAKTVNPSIYIAHTKP